MQKDVTSKGPIYAETIFNVVYLISVLTMGVLLIIKRQSDIAPLWGISALVLGFGDSFHLVPRILEAMDKKNRSYTKSKGIGKLITSITMTLFYMLLWHTGLKMLPNESLLRNTFFTALIYILSILRIILSIAPQNKWQEGGNILSWGIYRNIPFVLQGILVMILYIANAQSLVWLAILLSFLFYIPVVLWVQKNPKLGMLMIPKTCAYLWMIAMGFLF